MPATVLTAGVGTVRSTPLQFVVQNEAPWSILIHAGENTQRSAIETKLRLAKVSDIILTEISASSIGGLMGALLTIDMGDCLADPTASLNNVAASSEWAELETAELPAGFQGWSRKTTTNSSQKRRVTIWGPPPLKLCMQQGIQNFAPIRHFELVVIEVEKDGDVMIPLSAAKMDAALLCTFVTSHGTDECPSKRQRCWGKRLAFFLCEKVRPGTMDAKKVEALGKPGKWRADLKRGLSVTLPCGRVVQPSEVCGPDIVSPVVGFGFSQLLLDKDNWQRRERLFLSFWEFGEFDSQAAVVENFGDWRPKHFNFRVRTEYATTTLKASELFVRRFNAQTAAVFAPPAMVSTNSLSKTPTDDPGGGLLRSVRLLEEISLRENAEFRVTLSEEAKTEDEDLASKVDLELLAEFEGLKAGSTFSGPRLIFLGTGAALPSKFRNVAGILLDYPEIDFAILLDCGEGSVSQLCRGYKSEFPQVMRRLRAVSISHRHADHHMGLFGLFNQRRALGIEDACPLTVFVPDSLKGWVHCLKEEIEPTRNVEVIPFGAGGRWLFKDPQNSSRVVSLRSTEVQHIRNSLGVYTDCFGVRVEVPFSVERGSHTGGSCYTCNGHNPMCESDEAPGKVISVVYSGDTLPCESLERLAASADFLIHEGTFGWDEEDLALQKRHCTFVQAAAVAKRAKCKTVILTHFSQRYSAQPSGLLEDDDANAPAAIYANDLMCIYLQSDISNLARLQRKMLKRTFFADSADALRRDD